MIIKEIKVTPVSMPTSRPCVWSQGSALGHSRSIIEITTEDGLTGLGECFGITSGNIISTHFTPKLINQSYYDVNHLKALCVGNHRDFGAMAPRDKITAFSGIEMACWDLQGKKLNQPLYRLLGGPVRDRALFGAYSFTVDLNQKGTCETDIPTIMAEIAAESLAVSGATIFEFKIGRNGVECDIETVHKIREKVGTAVSLGVDANMGFTYFEARKFLQGIASANCAFIEEPVASLSEMNQLAADFNVLVSTHNANIETMLAYPNIRGIVVDIGENGGIDETIKLAYAISQIGKQAWLRSCIESGISWAAMCHLGYAVRDFERPGQSLINWMEDDLVLGERWSVKNGGVIPTDKPGLGVDLDYDALEKYHQCYLDQGEMTYFDSP